MPDERGGARGGDQRPHESTILDLLLDLVFVFALNRVAGKAVHALAEEQHLVLPRAGEALLLFLALWLVWYYAALTASRFDPRRPAIQAVIFGVAFGSVVMGVSAPEAFDGHGAHFVAAYLTIQVGRPLALLILQRRGVQRRPLLWPPVPARLLFWSTVAAVPWVAGALVPADTYRGALWALGLTIEYVGLLLGWPTPGLGQSRIQEWELFTEYLADRYRQFFIIALGESILLTGLTFSVSEFGSGQTIAFVTAFVTTALLWRIYFYRAGSVLKGAVTVARQPVILITYGFLSHLVMVTGVITTAVGYGLAISHPYERPHPAWLVAVLGGPALFLVGRSRFEYDTFARVSPSRIVGILVLVALGPPLTRLPLLTAIIAAMAVLLGIALADATRAHGKTREKPAPPH